MVNKPSGLATPDSLLGLQPEKWNKSAITQRMHQDLCAKDGEKLKIEFTGRLIGASNLEPSVFNKLFNFSGRDRCLIYDLNIKDAIGFSPVVRNVSCVELAISGNDTIAHLQDCYIDHLTVMRSVPHSIRIEDCWIGCLTLLPASVMHLTLIDSGLLTLDVPANNEDNPFVGGISPPRLWLPSRQYEHRNALSGPQPWANIEFHLQALGKTEAAAKFHRIQMILEATKQRLWSSCLTICIVIVVTMAAVSVYFYFGYWRYVS